QDAGWAEQVERGQRPVLDSAAPGTGRRGPLRAPAVRPVPARRQAGAVPRGPDTGVVYLRPARAGRPGRADGDLHRDGGALMSPKESVALEVDGRTLTISNPGKVYFSKRGETKLDLVHYYQAVAEPLLGVIRDRPLLLERYPDGASGKSWFQKRVPA